jgi:hypothetical protein
MIEDRDRVESPTELGLRFGLPIAGLGEIATGSAAVGTMDPGGVLPGDSLVDEGGSPFAAGFRTAGAPAGLPLDDGLQVVPGQSGGEGLAQPK